MKRILFLSVVLMLSLCSSAQEKQANAKQEGYEFTTVKANPITSIKNQSHSSTCWAFSSLGYFESELLRKGKGTYDLSEMYVVHRTMEDRATNYVRLHGSSSFAPGGSFYDVVYCLKNYGIVPQSAMPGILYGDTVHNHGELDAVASAYVDAIAKGKQQKISPVWSKGLSAIYDTYLGKCPETFTYNGKTYTPKSFEQSLGLNMDDYVSLTSFTHHPFYTQFAIEVEDNWRNGLSWNIPIDELIKVMDNAVMNGYCVCWGSDVSESGFTRNGVAVVPDASAKDNKGTDMARWTGMLTGKMPVDKPGKEETITQEKRQLGYDNWQTTDDHGMMIYGIAKDQNGTEYYMVKNSWGPSGKYKGTWYASKAFVEYKTINILVHKDAIPKDIAKKIGIK
jgi:aminopeptidase C